MSFLPSDERTSRERARAPLPTRAALVMSESEEELDGGTVGEAVQQPAVKQEEEEEEEEELDGGVIGPPRPEEEEEEELDGGVLAEADLCHCPLIPPPA